MAKFLQKAAARMENKGTKGLFKRQAERRGMSTTAWARHEENSSDPEQRERANFAEVGMKLARRKSK